MCYDLQEGGWACHERLAIRVRIYVPMSVDTYVLDADDLAVFRAQTSAATVTDDTSLLSVRLPCTPLQGAPLRPRAALCAAAARLVLRHTYVLDAHDLAVFRAQTSAATVTDDTSLESVRLPCTPLQGAPLRPRAALGTAAAHLVLRLAEKC